MREHKLRFWYWKQAVFLFSLQFEGGSLMKEGKSMDLEYAFVSL